MDKKYQCCFCGKIIQSDNLDITSIILISNWDKDDEGIQKQQQFFCHMICFKNKIQSDIPLYLLD